MSRDNLKSPEVTSCWALSGTESKSEWPNRMKVSETMVRKMSTFSLFDLQVLVKVADLKSQKVKNFCDCNY